MSGADDLTARINRAKANIESARQYLAEAGELSRAIRISTAEDVLGLIRNGISKTELEARLIASSWHDVHGQHEAKQRVIWTNPSETSSRGKEKGLNTSVRIMTEEDGSSYARVYNGPTGGDIKDRDGVVLLDRQGKPIAAQALRLNENGKVVTGNNANTHFLLRSDLSTTPATNSFSSGGALRGVSRVLGPAGSLFGGAYSLYEAYEADGGFGENFSETAGGIAGGAAGGWGGAAAGAALGTVLIPIPGVGTVVGGIAGGIIGGIGGETVGEYLGGLF